MNATQASKKWKISKQRVNVLAHRVPCPIGGCIVTHRNGNDAIYIPDNARKPRKKGRGKARVATPVAKEPNGDIEVDEDVYDIWDDD